MKALFDWFGLFLLTTLLLGWCQAGICWMFCEVIVGDQRFFWPLMGIPMTFNMCASFCWAAGIWNMMEKKRKKRIEALTGKRGTR